MDLYPQEPRPMRDATSQRLYLKNMHTPDWNTYFHLFDTLD